MRMIWIALLLLLAACSEHDAGEGAPLRPEYESQESAATLPSQTLYEFATARQAAKTQKIEGERSARRAAEDLLYRLELQAKVEQSVAVRRLQTLLLFHPTSTSEPDAEEYPRAWLAPDEQPVEPDQ